MNYRQVFPTEVIRGFTDDGMFVLMMYDPAEDKQVPIMIGEHEANMILLEQGQLQPRRPMTHQLIGSLFEAFSLKLKLVRIDRFEEGIYYATLQVSDGFTTKTIDARASDAVVLALRQEVDIEMAEQIIDEVGFTPQREDLDLFLEPSEEMTIEELKEELRRCEENEEYERAAEIMETIRKRQQ